MMTAEDALRNELVDARIEARCAFEAFIRNEVTYDNGGAAAAWRTNFRWMVERKVRIAATLTAIDDTAQPCSTDPLPPAA